MVVNEEIHISKQLLIQIILFISLNFFTLRGDGYDKISSSYPVMSLIPTRAITGCEGNVLSYP